MSKLESIDAMILAAGLGTRVRPLTHRIPKALLPVCGRPLLEWNLRFLGQVGIPRVVVNTHHLTEVMGNWLERECPKEFQVDDRSISIPEVKLVKEPVILGTAGGVANARSLLQSDPALVWNVDLLFQPDLEAALDFHRSEDFIATLVLVRDPQFAKIALDGKRITQVAPQADPANSTLWAYTGIILFSQEALSELPSVGFDPLPPYLRQWAASGRLGGYRAEATFREVGTLEGYWEIHRELAGPLRDELLVGAPPEAARQPGGFGFIASSATVSPNSHVEESIILGGATIQDGADVRRSIVGFGANVSGEIENVATAEDEVRTLALLPHRLEVRLDRFLLEHAETWPTETWPKDIARAVKKGKRTPRIRRLQGDGSSRQIFRVTLESESRIAVVEPAPVPNGSDRQIYPVRPLESGEESIPTPLQSFLYMRRFLEDGNIRVPKLLATDLEGRLVLLEDLGDQLLASLPQEEQLPFFEQAVDILIAIAELTPEFQTSRVQSPTFDAAFGVEFEAGYFQRQFLAEIAKGQPDDPSEEYPGLAEEFERIAAAAIGSLPLVLIHRDFQSRNLMVRGTDLAVIDFQGARLGPVTYDLASLLFDPYNTLDATERDSLLQRYLDQRSVNEEQEQTLKQSFQNTALQRLLQNLGAFAFLGRTLQKPGFWDYVPIALERALELSAKNYPVLTRALEVAAVQISREKDDI